MTDDRRPTTDDLLRHPTCPWRLRRRHTGHPHRSDPLRDTTLPAPATPELQRLRDLGRLLDAAVGIPGTRWRVGLDSLIGLIPGFGDAAGAVLSTYIILAAARMGAPRATLLRMAANVGVETVVGAVPLFGDLFDAGWKANLRNLRLLEGHLAAPTATARASRGWLVAVIGALLLLLVAAGAFAAMLVAALLRGVGLV